jgi:hypothetical protein
MAGMLGYMAAGAVKGVAKGWEETGKEKREQRLLELQGQQKSTLMQQEHQLGLQRETVRSENDRKNREFSAGEERKTREASDTKADERANRQVEGRRGMLSNIVTDESGRYFGITEGGERKDLGIKARIKEEKPDPNADGLSAAEKRAMEIAIRRHTKEDPKTFAQVTDWDGVASSLEGAGHKDAAKLVRGNGPAAEAPSVDVSKIPAGAVAYLKSNPTLKADFDKKYGQGAADAVLRSK